MKKHIYICLLAITIFSCSRDLGNYDYIEIDDITIDEVPENLGDLILLEDTIKITPIVGPKTDFDNDNFNYFWSLKKGTGSAAKMERFAEQKNLILPVTKAGEISLMFEVEHKETGILKYQIVNARGVSKMSNGMYVLKETASGDTDLDMIAYNTETNESNVYPDLISLLNGSSMSGAPVTLDYWGYRKDDFENAKLVAVPALRIASKQDITVINTDEFEVLARFDDLFLGDVPTVRNIQNLKSINKNTLLINDGKAYMFANYNVTLSGENVVEYGGNKFLPMLNGDYNMASPVSWAPKDSSSEFLTYDNNSGLFKYLRTSFSEPGTIREFPGSNNFSEDFKSDLLFIESTATGVFSTSIFALLKSKETPNDLALLEINTNYITNGYLNQTKRSNLNAQDYKIDEASLYSVHQHRKVIYFVVDNSIWKYDTSSKTEEMVLSFSGQEITFIDVVNEWYTEEGATIFDLNYTKLVVGTYSGGQYTLNKYNINGVTPETTPYFSQTGEGKIKDYAFIKPNTTPITMWRTVAN